MEHERFEGERTLMRIHIGESDRWHGKPLYQAIVELLRREKFSGVTVLRGVGGYGSSSVYHTEKILRLSQDLPIVVEVVESNERIEGILPQLDEMIELLEKLDKKLDALALTSAASSPVVQPEVSEPVKPAPAKRARKASTAATPAATPVASNVNGEDHDVEDEDALRARVEFEARRVQRLIGISGMRAAISRVADGVLRIDDVPAAQLEAALTALQAL
jgi:PII-like signaling protein